MTALVALVVALVAMFGTPADPGAQPEIRTHAWACTQPMTIRPAIQQGIPVADVKRELLYAVATLALYGYAVQVGEPVEYVADIDPDHMPGTVLLVVAADPTSQRDLNGAKAARARRVFNGPEIQSGAVYIDAAGGALSGDIILHELGHLLGLEHKEETVMGEAWGSPVWFDAAQVTAIDCR